MLTSPTEQRERADEEGEDASGSTGIARLEWL